MFTADPRFRHLPARREHIAAIHVSVNSPALTLPGKPNQPVQAAVVGICSGNRFGVFIHLFLTQSLEPIVYVDATRSTVQASDYRALEEDGLAFVESLGFIMESLNYRVLPAEEQEQLLKTLPCFLQDHSQLAQTGKKEPTDSSQLRLARIAAAF